jgi:hypothetical protein
VVPGISWGKKGKIGMKKRGIKARSLGANLCSARMGIYRPLIGDGIERKEMGDEDGKSRSERRGISVLRNF